MKCPNCSAEAAAGATECAGCGIIFAKFRKKLEALESPPPAKAVSLWKGRVAALAFVLLWCAGLALYYRRAIAELRSRPSVPGRSGR